MEGSGGLRRHLGRLDASAIFVGIILGSGIFVAPAAVARAAPGPLAGTALWALGGLVAAAGAFCYAECASRLPRTGGFLVFYREAFGEAPAFVGGWAAILVTYPASIAAIALILGTYLKRVVPAAPDPEWSGAAAIALSGLLNVVGLRTGPWTQRVLTTTKVLVLAALCLAAVVASRGGTTTAPPPPADLGAAAVLGALVVLLFTYDGWTDVTLVAGEVREPRKDLGPAVALGVAVLVILYAGVQLSVGALLEPARAAASDRVVAEAVEAGLGARAGGLVAALVVLSTFGSIHGIVLAASRLGFAMAREGLFSPVLGVVHPRWGTPARSIAGLVAASIVYVFVAGFRGLLGFFTFNVWIFYGATAVALLVLRRNRVGEGRSWRAPGGLAAPAIVLVTAASMTVGLLLESPRRSLVGVALLLAGFPVWALWRALAGRR